MAKLTSTPSDTLALYDKAVAALPGVERKGAAMPYTSLNGHMFSFITKEGQVALRLPDDERKAFVKRFKSQPCVQNGSVMKEYVLVPESLLKKSADLGKYLTASRDYVGSLKPKSTKREKKNS